MITFLPSMKVHLAPVTAGEAPYKPDVSIVLGDIVDNKAQFNSLVPVGLTHAGPLYDHGKIQRYNWVGYLSVAIVASTFFIAQRLAKHQKLR